MEALRLKHRFWGLWRHERGFTLPEVLTAIAILGIILAIAVMIWLGILERRRVDAAANQVAADLRLAHTSATNQLTDWRVVLAPEKADESAGPDYYLVKLNAPYPATSPPSAAERIPRTLPANVKIRNHNAALNDNQAASWWVSPVSSGSAPDPTRTSEFNSDGAMAFYAGSSGSVCVTVDGDPERKITVQSATSRVKIKDEAC